MKRERADALKTDWASRAKALAMSAASCGSSASEVRLTRFDVGSTSAVSASRRSDVDSVVFSDARTRSTTSERLIVSALWAASASGESRDGTDCPISPRSWLMSWKVIVALASYLLSCRSDQPSAPPAATSTTSRITQLWVRSTRR